MLQHLVATNNLRTLVDFIRHIFGCRPTVRYVVFDAEVIVRSSGIVAGCQENATICLVLSDNVRGCRGGQNSVLSDNELANTIRRADLEDRLHRLWREETPIATDNEGRSLGID